MPDAVTANYGSSLKSAATMTPGGTTLNTDLDAIVRNSQSRGLTRLPCRSRLIPHRHDLHWLADTAGVAHLLFSLSRIRFFTGEFRLLA